MIDYTEVIKYLRPGAMWVVVNNEYEGISINSGEPVPTKMECEAAWEEIGRDVMLRPVRAKRNRLLIESDWTQVADAPVDTTAWAEYRQALRDLPANTTDPENPVWPTPPE